MEPMAGSSASSASAELIRAVVDDSAMAAAALQALTSLRATIEASLTSPPSAVISEASEMAGNLQNLCQRLRQRAVDAQRVQLEAARAVERESATAKTLDVTKKALAEQPLVLARTCFCPKLRNPRLITTSLVWDRSKRCKIGQSQIPVE